MILSHLSRIIIPLNDLFIGNTRLGISIADSNHSSTIILRRPNISGLKDVMLNRFDRRNTTVGGRDDCLLYLLWRRTLCSRDELDSVSFSLNSE